jgi:hypothetical protein
VVRLMVGQSLTTQLTSCWSSSSSMAQRALSLYRIRTNVRSAVGEAASYDAPPTAAKRKPGRYDDTDLPVLYAAFDIETCIHECRCTVVDEIVLATFHANRDLTTIDFQDLRLSVATEDEYPKCRMLARRMLELHVDGFTYRSFFSSVKADELTNIALFGHPIRDGKLSMASLNRIKLDRIDYRLSLGPVMHYDEA